MRWPADRPFYIHRSDKPKPHPSYPYHSFIKRFLLAHLLRNVPKKRIADCQPGDYVKVTGQVR